MKTKIRNLNKNIRKEMSFKDVSEKSLAASKIFLASDIYKDANTLMLYMPLGNETDTSYIIKQALSDRKKLVLPVTDFKTGKITPYYFNENTVLRKGAFCVSEPNGTDIADYNGIDAVIVPGIAFDKNGARVGFGKGCYDRFLKNISALKIGFCYDFQICEKITADEHDIKMDYLITENGMTKCEN